MILPNNSLNYLKLLYFIGFLDFEKLFQIVNSVGCHMAHDDFRAIANQVDIK